MHRSSTSGYIKTVNILEIDADLNIRSKTPLSLLRPVRVTISVSIDYSYLEKEATNRMFDNPDIYYTFLTEYIEAYNNFKTEQQPLITDNTFYRDILTTMGRYLNLGREDVVTNILKIIIKDHYINRALGRILVSGALGIYPQLTQKTIATVNWDTYEITLGFNNDGGVKSTTQSEQADVDRFIMRTVMSNYVEAHRQD